MKSSTERRPGGLAVLLGKEVNVGLRSASLYLLVGLPIVVSLVMRVVLSGGGTKPPKLAITGQAEPALERVVTELGRGPKAPVRLAPVRDEAQGRALLAKGKIQGLLVLGPDFDSELAAGRRPLARLYFDEAGGTSAFSLHPVIRELLRMQARQQEPARLEVKGIRGISPWQAMLPAWVVMVLLATLTLMPTSLASERQTKTLQAVLVTPIGLGEFVTGKALYGVLVGLVGGIAVLGVNLARVGNIALVIVLLCLGAALATLLGLLVGLLVESPQAASGIATGLYVPLLWGAFFADLSGVVGALSRMTPSFHLAHGLRQALYSQGSFSSMWLTLAGLGAATALLGLLCVWALRRAEQRM
ncbi:MAG: ABC transporter permease [Polyangia bacterium]|jgi:ABC-2 type transport system permease protein|nr:ABC transporter permease [Polyangia bacterium]